MKVVLKIVFQVITKELYVKVMYTIKSYDENFSFSVVLFFFMFYYVLKFSWQLFFIKIVDYCTQKLYDEFHA